MTDTVNSQITDSITQAGVSVVGGASAQAMGMVYQSTAHAISLLMQNSVSTQGGMQQINAAVIASACKQILAAPTQRMNAMPNLMQLGYTPGLPNAGNLPPSGDNQNNNANANANANHNTGNENQNDNKAQQLKVAKEQAKNALQDAVDQAKRAADADGDALQAVDLILQNSSDSPDKIKQAFVLAQQASKASKNASVALALAQSSAAKAQDASDVETATMYAKQTQDRANDAKDAADKAKAAATSAEELATQ